MELKRPRFCVIIVSLKLLIVPYGIETRHFQQVFHVLHLLIVPYGIETFLA